MNKAEEMRELANKACMDSSFYGQIIEDIEIAAREGRRSIETSVPHEYEVRAELNRVLVSEGFEISDYNQYVNKQTISW